MTRLEADITWRIAGEERLDARLLDLLRALQRHSTLRAAAEDLGLSYRAAWGLLLDVAARVGAPLAELQRGKGARLTRFGLDLLKSDERLRQAMSALNERHAVSPRPGAFAGAPLRLVASHDPLLADFCERVARPARLVDEVSFRGSEDSLALYGADGAELVGFHLEPGADAASVVQRHLKPKRDRLVRFADRAQGLIVARGNPKKLASLGDVARRHARFVNRQKGSGTRRLTDRLLGGAGIDPSRIRGYETEEYTHLAVAATIASGHADAGLGVHAAASNFDLDFVPLARERYWLALRERTLASPTAQRLLRALSGKPLSRLLRGRPGYDLAGAGELHNVEEALL